MLDPQVWSKVPPHFWAITFFVFGCIVGSFLNVCIHRMPLGQSIVAPPSHCPHCKYSIPWFLNIPLVTWVYLGGKCKNCGSPISVRYFLVELLTGICFLGAWLVFGARSPWVALIYAGVLAGLIVSTFIDFEHFIIPDELTIGGVFVGLICSALVPQLHQQTTRLGALKLSVLGTIVGGGLIYLVVRLGKLVFGRKKILFPAEARIVFTENSIVLPEGELPYEEVFYRKSDTIALRARTLELVDRCYRDVIVRLNPAALQIGEERFNPEDVPHMEAKSKEIVIPREAMGLGDVKFMAAIGAFLGWQSVVFSLFVSSFVGAVVGFAMIALGKRELGSRIPYGPYIALAAALWIFFGPEFTDWWWRLSSGLMGYR
ncbi:MAG: prepilin peptidase [Verrucomicrobia bacterium]|nr:MAG: prepilin peptidase [Verrucomicrobiota bacterium]